MKHSRSITEVVELTKSIYQDMCDWSNKETSKVLYDIKYAMQKFKHSRKDIEGCLMILIHTKSILRNGYEYVVREVVDIESVINDYIIEYGVPILFINL